MKEDDVKPDIMVKIIVITGSMAVLKPMVSQANCKFGDIWFMAIQAKSFQKLNRNMLCTLIIYTELFLRYFNFTALRYFNISQTA
jgi:hypothetical protein